MSGAAEHVARADLIARLRNEALHWNDGEAMGPLLLDAAAALSALAVRGEEGEPGACVRPESEQGSAHEPADASADAVSHAASGSPSSSEATDESDDWKLTFERVTDDDMPCMKPSHAALVAERDAALARAEAIQAKFDRHHGFLDQAEAQLAEGCEVQIRGGVVRVDRADLLLVTSHSWHVLTNAQGKPYARTRITDEDGKRRHVLMHRLLLQAPADLEVDHKNHDTLDNRRDNLRLVTHGQNAQNRKPYSASGYKGVHKKGNRWRAFIGNPTVMLGSFKTPEEAAHAFDAAALERYGEHAYLNFPAVAGVSPLPGEDSE